MSDRVVLGVFEDYEQATQALEALRDAGFKPEDISVVGANADDVRMAAVDLQSNRPAKIITYGGILGAIGGWLVGLAAVSIPGVGPFLAAGPLLAAFSGAAAGSMIGTWAGVFIHFDVPEYEAEIYQGHLSEGKVIVGLHSHAHDERVEAEDIMDRFGAIDIEARREPAARLANPAG